MDEIQTFPAAPATAWHSIVIPKEHGSWSLAFEPVVLGLLCVPSLGGCLLGVAVTAGFFARRPLRVFFREHRNEQRRAAAAALITCVTMAGIAMAAAIGVAGAGWLAWLIPAVLCGGVFVAYDIRNNGRAECAEIAGAAAFASLPGAFAAIGHASLASALALSLVMSVRAVPTVILVRATVRARKSGGVAGSLPLFSAAFGLAISVALVAGGWAPRLVGVWALLLLARAVFMTRHPLRAKTLGMIEAVLGIAFVVTTAAAWA
jgi:hypothetical protein